MLYIGDQDIQRLVLETFLQLSESDNERFSDEAMKYEETVSDCQNSSLWHWICETTQTFIKKRSAPLEDAERVLLLNLVRVVLRLVDRDQSSIEYLLQAGLNDYLVAILQWNNPLEQVDNEFSLELDTLVNSIVLHIVQSGLREYGNTLIDGG